MRESVDCIPQVNCGKVCGSRFNMTRCMTSLVHPESSWKYNFEKGSNKIDRHLDR